MKTPEAIAIIGFGEVGQILARHLRESGIARIAVFDLAFARSDSGPARALATAPVEARESAAAAAKGADIVISSVTAEQALNAVRAIAPGLDRGTFVVDVNSVSPGVKREAATVIDGAHGRYIESAIMSAILPKGLRAPMLLGGPHAKDFLAFAAPLKLNAKVFADIVGGASAVKMSRSVVIKGLEAIVTESMLTARHYGVEREVLASLAETLALPDWPEFARYLISRSLEHGKRRAEEMREVAKTVAEAGLPPLMSARTADRQGRTFDLGRADAISADALLAPMLDALLGAERKTK